MNLDRFDTRLIRRAKPEKGASQPVLKRLRPNDSRRVGPVCKVLSLDMPTHPGPFPGIVNLIRFFYR